MSHLEFNTGPRLAKIWFMGIRKGNLFARGRRPIASLASLAVVKKKRKSSFYKQLIVNLIDNCTSNSTTFPFIISGSYDNMNFLTPSIF